MKDSSPLILFAPNVHSGGGFILLQELLSHWPSNKPLRAFLDKRVCDKLIFPDQISVQWVSPHFASHLLAQYKLYLESRNDHTIICFNGLPPLFAIRGKITVFLQNRLLIDDASTQQYPLRVRLRLITERLFCRLYRYRVTEYIVQTKSMRGMLTQWFGDKNPPVIRIIPFAKIQEPLAHVFIKKDISNYNFLYIADGLPHKNHKKLLSAWCILASENIKPKLLLTLAPEETSLLNHIARLVASSDIKIENLGNLLHNDLLSVLKSCDALIYPSITESLGLPLVEAHQLEKAIIASELDYVRDICIPIQTFDPYSATSIARAVKRFISVDEQPRKVTSAAVFWEMIIN